MDETRLARKIPSSIEMASTRLNSLNPTTSHGPPLTFEYRTLYILVPSADLGTSAYIQSLADYIAEDTAIATLGLIFVSETDLPDADSTVTRTLIGAPARDSSAICLSLRAASA